MRGEDCEYDPNFLDETKTVEELVKNSCQRKRSQLSPEEKWRKTLICSGYTTFIPITRRRMAKDSLGGLFIKCMDIIASLYQGSEHSNCVRQIHLTGQQQHSDTHSREDLIKQYEAFVAATSTAWKNKESRLKDDTLACILLLILCEHAAHILGWEKLVVAAITLVTKRLKGRINSRIQIYMFVAVYTQMVSSSLGCIKGWD